MFGPVNSESTSAARKRGLRSTETPHGGSRQAGQLGRLRDPKVHQSLNNTCTPAAEANGQSSTYAHQRPWRRHAKKHQVRSMRATCLTQDRASSAGDRPELGSVRRTTRARCSPVFHPLTTKCCECKKHAVVEHPALLRKTGMRNALDWRLLHRPGRGSPLLRRE